MAAQLPPFTSGQLEQLARILGDTHTGDQLNNLLDEAGMPPSEISTKWRRLLDSMERAQRASRTANPVARFLKTVMHPTRFMGRSDTFEATRVEVNEVLAFAALRLESDGRLVRVRAARTLSEAEERADRLRSRLRAREVHPDVLQFCRAELLQENYFHAVLEAAKSVAQKIRDRTGLTGDAATLADAAFSTASNMPPLAFNALRDPNEVGEHRGLATMTQGFFMAFRNPPAHAPRARWAVDEEAALDMLAVASMLHRRLDSAVVTQRLSRSS